MYYISGVYYLFLQKYVQNLFISLSMASAYFKLKLLKRKRNNSGKNQDEIEASSIDTTDICKENKELKKCRICLQEGTLPIYGNKSFAEYPEYIRQFGDIEININDEFPKYLCVTCNNQLQNAIMFRKKAKESDNILQQNKTSVVNNITVDDPDENEDNLSEDDVTDSEGNLSSKNTHCKLSLENRMRKKIKKNAKKQKSVRIQCSICFRIVTSHLFKKHLAKHQSTTHLICEVCGKLYRKDKLIRHLQLHTYDLPHQCQLCPYRGRFVDSLKLHMRTHIGNKPFSCDKCQLTFHTKSNLNRHLLTHKKEKPLKCTECTRGFYFKRDFDAHFKADHAGIKDYGCRICCNKYGTRKALLRHELRVHKRDKLAKGRVPLYLQPEYRNS